MLAHSSGPAHKDTLYSVLHSASLRRLRADLDGALLMLSEALAIAVERFGCEYVVHELFILNETSWRPIYLPTYLPIYLIPTYLLTYKGPHLRRHPQRPRTGAQVPLSVRCCTRELSEGGAHSQVRLGWVGLGWVRLGWFLLCGEML